MCLEPCKAPMGPMDASFLCGLFSSGMVLRITPVAGGLKTAQYAAMREMKLSLDHVPLTSKRRQVTY